MNWQQLEDLFHAALERAPEERSAFVKKVCVGDEEMLRKLQALLAAHAAAGSFIEKGAVAVEAKELAAEQKGTAAAQAVIGQTISHYRIIRRLGAGAMGEVFLAQDTTLRRQVALKLLPAHFTNDAERLRRFEQEARSASALNHPNILTIYETGQAESVRYIATEFVEGLTLREFIEGKPVAIASALDVAVQVAGALAAAHSKGIVHRDIKPENIMISRGSHMLPGDSNVKVLDFGIAKLTEPEVIETELPTRPLVSTSDGITLGTTPYMSPEQARAEKVDARTDIWSLGVMLYEMIGGRTPFEGATRSHIVVSILEKEPLPLRQLADIPEALQWIVTKALRKDKDERYQTARELHSDLRDVRRQLAEGNRESAQLSSASAAVAESSKTERETAILPHAVRRDSLRSAGRRKWLAAAIIAVVIAAAGITLGFNYLWTALITSKASAPFSRFQITRLTTTGKASSAAVSPDGKYVVHVKESVGQQSLWLKHIVTGSDKQIVPTNGNSISGLTFSPDGNRVYFVRKESAEIVLSEVPVLGGPTRRLVSDIDTAATLSPDGKRFAFIRGYPPADETSLIVANADGTGEQKIVTHPMNDFFGPTAASPAWSPDGEQIAFARSNASSGKRYFDVTTVRLSDKTEKQLTSSQWGQIGAVCWTHDGKALLFTAIEEERRNFQIWYVPYQSGAARQITNDLNNYESLTLTADGKSLVTVQTEGTSDIWIITEGDTNRAAQITANRFDGVPGIVWTPDGRIVHASRVSGNPDIWIMKADGTEDRQLTANPAVDLDPVVSPDGKYIAFESNRTGVNNIWRMDIDGKNQTQLSFGINEHTPLFSLDGKWIIFVAVGGGAGKNASWKVPVEGGTPIQMGTNQAMTAAISPKDGKIAFRFADYQANPPQFRTAFSGPDGGTPLKVFDFPEIWGTIGPGFFAQHIAWTADGRSLTYIDTKDGVSNIWAQPIDGRPAKKLTDFTSEMIFNYAWSVDGKKLALARGSKSSDVVLISDLSQSR